MPFYIRYYANREDTLSLSPEGVFLKRYPDIVVAFHSLMMRFFWVSCSRLIPDQAPLIRTGYLNGMTGEHKEPGTNFY